LGGLPQKVDGTMPKQQVISKSKNGASQDGVIHKKATSYFESRAGKAQVKKVVRMEKSPAGFRSRKTAAA